jgi:hypothetical protein
MRNCILFSVRLAAGDMRVDDGSRVASGQLGNFATTLTFIARFPSLPLDPSVSQGKSLRIAYLDIPETTMNKPNKMAFVRAFLSAHPDASATEIVSGLAKQKIKISVGVASNYKSVIKSRSKRLGRKKTPAPKAPATGFKSRLVKTKLSASANGSAAPVLPPQVMELLKAGRALGWKQVKSIVDLMLEL